MHSELKNIEPSFPSDEATIIKSPKLHVTDL